MHHIEVYKQAERFTSELQVRKYLCKMYGGDAVNGLDLHNYEIFDNQIQAVADPKPELLNSCFRQAVYVLSNNPGPSSVCTLIAAVMMAWLTCWEVSLWIDAVAISVCLHSEIFTLRVLGARSPVQDGNKKL
jgi:hypothetical protein